METALANLLIKGGIYMRFRCILVFSVIVACVLAVGIICILTSEEVTFEMKKKGDIFIDGKNTALHWYISKENPEVALLPIVDILVEMGVSVDWINSRKAILSIRGEQFLLDTHDGTLQVINEEIDLLVPAPGSEFGKKHCVMKDTFFIDSDSCMFLLYNIQRAYIDIDPVKNAMYIVSTAP